MRLIDADEFLEYIEKEKALIPIDAEKYHIDEKVVDGMNAAIRAIENEIKEQPTAYDVDKVVEEVKKLDLDGVSMVEDGKYKLVRKNEVISLIQTNGVCNGRDTTCADCYKMNCPLSTKKHLQISGVKK